MTWREFYREVQESMHSFYIAFSVVESCCKVSAFTTKWIARFSLTRYHFESIKVNIVWLKVCAFSDALCVDSVCGQWEVTGRQHQLDHSSSYGGVALQTKLIYKPTSCSIRDALWTCRSARCCTVKASASRDQPPFNVTCAQSLARTAADFYFFF